MPVVESLYESRRTALWHGYYGGNPDQSTLIMRLPDYCQTEDIGIEERYFTLE